MAILILVSIMASMAATFSRHVIVDSQATIVSSTMLDSAVLLDSERDFVLQSQRVGRTVSKQSVDSALSVGKLGDGIQKSHAEKKMVLADMVDGERSKVFSQVLAKNGLGATRLLETARVPAVLTSAPDELPSLDTTVAWNVLNDVDIEVLQVTTDLTLSGVEFEGVLVVHESVVLTLNDVIVRGAILSAASSSDSVLSAHSQFSQPQVVFTGVTRLLEADFLPGLAIHMPDGRVVADHALARVEIRGDIVAHSLSLQSKGSFEGNSATVQDPVIGASVDRIGAGRTPREWSSVLDHQGVWEAQFIAVIPRELELSDVTAITQFSLPAKSSADAGDS